MGQHSDPLNRVRQLSDLTQLRKVALRAVCSEMLEPTKSKAVIWFFRSSRHGCKVRKYKKSAHHVTPILESTSHGHSSHTKLKSTHNDCNTVLPLYFLFFFSALFSIRNPALLAPHQRQKIHPTKLPTRAICFSPETWNVTKRISFS